MTKLLKKIWNWIKSLLKNKGKSMTETKLEGKEPKKTIEVGRVHCKPNTDLAKTIEREVVVIAPHEWKKAEREKMNNVLRNYSFLLNRVQRRFIKKLTGIFLPANSRTNPYFAYRLTFLMKEKVSQVRKSLAADEWLGKGIFSEDLINDRDKWKYNISPRSMLKKVK